MINLNQIIEGLKDVLQGTEIEVPDFKCYQYGQTLGNLVLNWNRQYSTEQAYPPTFFNCINRRELLLSENFIGKFKNYFITRILNVIFYVVDTDLKRKKLPDQPVPGAISDMLQYYFRQLQLSKNYYESSTWKKAIPSAIKNKDWLKLNQDLNPIELCSEQEEGYIYVEYKLSRTMKSILLTIDPKAIITEKFKGLGTKYIGFIIT